MKSIGIFPYTPVDFDLGSLFQTLLVSKAGTKYYEWFLYWAALGKTCLWDVALHVWECGCVFKLYTNRKMHFHKQNAFLKWLSLAWLFLTKSTINRAEQIFVSFRQGFLLGQHKSKHNWVTSWLRHWIFTNNQSFPLLLCQLFTLTSPILALHSFLITKWPVAPCHCSPPHHCP